MSKKNGLALAVSVLVVLTFAGSAAAGLLGTTLGIISDLSNLVVDSVKVYEKDHDVHVSIECDQAAEKAIEANGGSLTKALATDMYNAQEGLHQKVTDLTKESIDHYYIWVGACGQSAPVDPMKIQS